MRHRSRQSSGGALIWIMPIWFLHAVRQCGERGMRLVAAASQHCFLGAAVRARPPATALPGTDLRMQMGFARATRAFAM